MPSSDLTLNQFAPSEEDDGTTEIVPLYVPQLIKSEPVSVFPPCAKEKESDDVSAWIHALYGGGRSFQVTGTATILPAPVVNLRV